MQIADARRLARELLIEHGLFGWHVKITRAVRVFGYCNSTKQTIGLSGPLTELNDEADVRDTILHEIAHALTPKDRGHGWEWRAKAREIGARPVRCYSTQVVTPPKKWAVSCRCGAKSVTRHRRPNARIGFRCTICGEGPEKWCPAVVKRIDEAA